MPNQKAIERESVQESYRFCERLAFSHYENFPVASFFIPKDKRKYIAAIYAFARSADDFADEPGYTKDERLARLKDWSAHLELCYRNEAHHPIFLALGETVRKFQIQRDLLERLLTAFESDVTTIRYQTFDDVLSYCKNSADPVGRLVLLLFGYREEGLMKLSDNICTALQLTNFWQDLSVDLKKDRLYLPLEDLHRFGVSVEQLQERRFSQSFRDLMEFEVRRTRDLFERGKPLLAEVGKDLSLELRLTWLGGSRVLEKIRRRNYNVLHQRPSLTFADKMLLLARVFFRRAGN